MGNDTLDNNPYSEIDKNEFLDKFGKKADNLYVIVNGHMYRIDTNADPGPFDLGGYKLINEDDNSIKLMNARDMQRCQVYAKNDISPSANASSAQTLNNVNTNADKPEVEGPKVDLDKKVEKPEVEINNDTKTDLDGINDKPDAKINDGTKTDLGGKDKKPEVEINDGSKVDLSGKDKKPEVEINDGSKVDLGGKDKKPEVEINDGSKVDLSGKGKKPEVEINDGSKVDLSRSEERR